MPLETIDKEIIENTESEKTENPILAAMKITVSIPEDKWKNLSPSDKMRLLCERKEYLKST